MQFNERSKITILPLFRHLDRLSTGAHRERRGHGQRAREGDAGRGAVQGAGTVGGEGYGGTRLIYSRSTRKKYGRNKCKRCGSRCTVILIDQSVLAEYGRLAKLSLEGSSSEYMRVNYHRLFYTQNYNFIPTEEKRTLKTLIRSPLMCFVKLKCTMILLEIALLG